MSAPAGAVKGKLCRHGMRALLEERGRAVSSGQGRTIGILPIEMIFPLAIRRDLYSICTHDKPVPHPERLR